MYGDFVRGVRESRGLTQAQLSRVSGVSQPNISAIERGRRIPTLETLNRLVVACGYELAAVAGDSRWFCPLPRAGWFPDEDLPPPLPDDPQTGQGGGPPERSPAERGRLLTQLLDSVDAVMGGPSR